MAYHGTAYLYTFCHILIAVINMHLHFIYYFINISSPLLLNFNAHTIYEVVTIDGSRLLEDNSGVSFYIEL